MFFKSTMLFLSFAVIFCHFAAAFQIEVVDGREMYWEKPSDMRTAKGIIMFFHGCAHSAKDWFPKSQSCPACLGLPMEMSLIKQSLSHGYVVSVINSMSGCWGVHSDKDYVLLAAQRLYSTLQVTNRRFPLFFFGVSNGGSFCFHMTEQAEELAIKVTALAVMISSVKLTARNGKPPPAIFLPMAKDKATLHHVEETVRQYHAHRIPTDILLVLPQSINRTYFSDHCNAISPELSDSLVYALHAKRLLDSHGMLVDNPRQSEWREVHRTVS